MSRFNKITTSLALVIFLICAYCDWKGYTERVKGVVLFFQCLSFIIIILNLIEMEKKSRIKDKNSNPDAAKPK
jgi:hypothetical protein